jgi:Tol biopolymer transport system component
MRWPLTEGPGLYDALRPGSWAPDGSAILFSRFQPFVPGEGVPSDVFALTMADGQVHQLTDDGSSEYPSWSPDGTQIAFDASVSGRHQLFRMEADGTGRARLTKDSSDDSNAVWSR